MFVVVDKEGNKIDTESFKGEEIFCPVCSGEMVFKNGKVNISHFSHKSLKECDEWGEMSEWHKSWQDKFDIEYREVVLGEHRADILKDGCVIEFQKSPLSYSDLQDRIDYYSRENELIFVFDLRDKDIFKIDKKIEGDDVYSWKRPSRSIHCPFDSDYKVIFQISDNKLLWVRSASKNWRDETDWSNFVIYKELSIDNFIQYFSDLDKYMDILESRKQDHRLTRLNKRVCSKIEKIEEEMNKKYEKCLNEAMRITEGKINQKIANYEKHLNLELENRKKTLRDEYNMKISKIEDDYIDTIELDCLSYIENNKNEIRDRYINKIVADEEKKIEGSVEAKKMIQRELDKIAIKRDLNIMKSRENDHEMYEWIVNLFKDKNYLWVLDKVKEEAKKEVQLSLV